MGYLGIASLFAWSLTVSSLNAQTANRTATPDHASGTILPTEDAYGVLYTYRVTGLLSEDARRIGIEQFDSVLTERASHWIAARHMGPAQGFRRDAMGTLYVAAGDEARARAEFLARLNEPKLPLEDRAFTLALATRLFSQHPENAARMSVALEYLTQLDALPTEVSRVQYATHAAIASKFFAMGDGASATWHYEHAFSLLSKMPFWDRTSTSCFDRTQLENVAVYLAAQPEGRARIDSIARYLKEQFTPPQELVARDQMFLWMGNRTLRNLSSAVTLTNYLGRSALPITAHYWWNRPAPATLSSSEPGATIQTMADGRIRLLEFGDMECMWCRKSLLVLNRLWQTMPPNVEFLYVTVNLGRWKGTKHVTGPEEAAYLKTYYLTQRHYTVPIALWTGPDQPDPDGGWLVKPSPVWEAYAVQAKPLFMLIDGHGIVRHISNGYSKDLEQQMRALQYLMAEAERNTSKGGTQ